ncbi:N-acetylneuraminate epimerase [Defluviimonas sp. SAOS-178_SWC]|uniref:N-acetylneuraminate epimerase n=1 Tax=Defluviimonas sp. SAOS-178_SWC TaxID=3121287 RepID=UPI003222161C
MTKAWPDLPVAIKNGFAARIDDTIYTGLGSAGLRSFKLDLRNRGAGWQDLAPFAGPAPSQPAAAASGGRIYVFSGSGKECRDVGSPIVFDTVHCYDPARDLWERIETATPAGLLGASAVTRRDGSIALFGGFNKALFDRYMSDIAAIDKDSEPDLWNSTQCAFMGMPPEAYRWNGRVLLFHPHSNEWSDLGRSPYLPNAGAALIELGEQRVALISGEVKPGLRTDMAKTVDLSGDTAVWQALPALPPGHGGSRQEGVAGAYSGRIGERLIVAGGAAFPGARDAADRGRWFAHEGLAKTWSRDVFAFAEGKWTFVGRLTEGLAYGASFSLPEGVLIVGGEDRKGNARSEVFLLSVENGAIVETR